MMYRSLILLIVVFILASFVSSDSLYVFNLSLFRSAFAIPTDQTTVVLSTWGIPTNSANITSILSDFAGNVYFGESNPNKIGRLVPATNTFTEWLIASHPLAIAVNPGGNCFFADNIGRLGRLG